MDSSERFGKLSRVKQDLLKQRIQKAAAGESGAPTIPPRSWDDLVPLSPGQRRVWFWQQLEPDVPIYNRPLALRLLGDLDVAALSGALDEILRRHEILRAVFAVVDGEPVARIMPDRRLDLEMVDLSQVPAAERQGRLERLFGEQALRIFDLSQGPLVFATLARLGEGEHVLILVFHHIVFDAWSVRVLVRELSALYAAGPQAEPSPLPELPIQYADFAAWQRERLADQALAGQLAYWQRSLADLPPPLDLPTDRPRPDRQTYHGASYNFAIPAELASAVESLSLDQGTTSFTTLLAAFQVSLYRYTGQEDVVIGAPVAGRTQVETEGLIGLFINTLVLRGDLAGAPAFRTLLQRTRETLLGAFAHQELPFEELVAALNPERALNRTPLFQVLFNLENLPQPVAHSAGLHIEPLEFDTQVAPFDLALEIVKADTGLLVSFIYNTDLFDVTTVERFAAHYLALLGSAVAHPHLPVGELPMLTRDEQPQAPLGFRQAYDDKDFVPRLFEIRAAERPEAAALVFQEQHLTYRELNERANRLAHYLRARGVGPEVPVGICVLRSVEMVVGMLAVLKAGGAYIPMDADYPEERLAHMARESGARLVLSQASLRDRLPAQEAEIVFLDADWEQIAAYPPHNLDLDLHPGNAAYIIFTSGSTGLPKGVLIEHRGLLNLVHWTQDEFGITPQDRASQYASPSFDACVWELWPYLTAGACVHILDETVRLSPSLLIQWLVRQEITIGFVPTPMAELILSQPWPKDGSLRLLLTGGDVLHKFPPVDLPFELVNNYGPTECTVVSTSARLSSEGDLERLPSIGRPVANTRAYILDDRLQPVPTGVPGELYLAGQGLARGYLHRPELTAQSFIPDPFSKSGGERMYRTGDLARFMPDGNIEFLGRADHQVKIRGFRVELGEIEAALKNHPDIEQAVVVLRTDAEQETAPGKQYLVAYVVANPGREPVDGQLRGYLASKLPAYMLPALFMHLDELPLTPSGKLDRQALPVPEESRSVADEVIFPPRTAVEQVIAGIWADVLGLDRVGVWDNFFELGGHSLLALRVHALVEEVFGVHLPVRTIFDAPTVAEFAEALPRITAEPGRIEKVAQLVLQVAQLSDEEAQALHEASFSPAGAGAGEFAPDGEIVDSYPLSPVQAGIFFQSRYFPEGGIYNIQYRIALHQELDTGAFWRAWQTVVERHTILRTSFQLLESGPLQLLHRRSTIPIVEQDLRSLPAQERQARIDRFLQEDRRQVFDFERAPLMRLALFRLAQSEYRFVRTVHHLVSDGRTSLAMFEELFSIYETLRSGQPVDIEPARPYRDYIDWLEEQDFSSAQAYWRERFEGFKPPTPLGPDSTRPTEPAGQITPGYAGHSQRVVRLSGDLTSELQAFARANRVTLNTLLQGAWALLLSHDSGERAVVFGVTRACRRSVPQGLQNLAGPMVNTLPVRVDVSPGQPLLPWLLELREQWVRLRQYEHTPVYKIQEWCGFSHSAPLFESVVNFDHQSIQAALHPNTWTRGVKLEIELDQNPGYPLALTAFGEAPMSLTILFDSGRFDSGTIQHMLARLEILLRSILADPQACLGTLLVQTQV